MRMFVACCICVFASAANAESGFLRAVFTGSGYDGTSVVSLENGATVVPEPTELYASDCPEHTTYAFVTYMLMEPGETYFFRGAYDDYATLKIDDEWVLKQGGQCSEVTGSFTVSNVMRWHKFDLRVSNSSGNGGFTSNIANKLGFGGILFKKGEDGAWQRFMPEGGCDFRIADGGRIIFWNAYEVCGDAVLGKVTFSQSDVDGDLVFASSQDRVNWSEKVVRKLNSTDKEYDFNVQVDPAKPFVRFGTRQRGVEDWTATIDLSRPKDPVLGEITHSIAYGEDDVTFSIPVLALGSGAKKAKVYVRHGLVGGDDFKKTQVASVRNTGILTGTLEGLEVEKEYQYSIIVQNAVGGITESKPRRFTIQRVWTYVIQPDGTIRVQDVSPSTGELVVPPEIDGYKVSGVKNWGLCHLDAEKITLPEGLVYIGPDSFYDCHNLTTFIMPSTLRYSYGSYTYYTPGTRIEYFGPAPEGDPYLKISSGYYAREFAASWLDIIDISTFKGYWQTNLQNVVVVSTAMRKNDPTVMDVRFKVLSEKPTVKVRVLAFEDGERSFAKVVRPVTFIDGTETSIGDSIAANQEHQLSWRVSADWKIDVAKVKFEVLAVEDDILPLELTTLPRIGEHPSIEYSWNVMEESRVLDALFWLYADGRAGLEITDGVLKNGGTKLADGAKLNGYSTIAYVYEGMGYRVLAGEELEHVKNISRLKLSPNGFRQYAVKTLE